MKLAYNGSHGSVYVNALGRVVEHGEPVEVDSARTARQLRRQGWRKVREEDDNDNKNDEKEGNE